MRCGNTEQPWHKQTCDADNSFTRIMWLEIFVLVLIVLLSYVNKILNL